MATWTYVSYMARLRHEANLAHNPKAIARLRATLKAVEASRQLVGQREHGHGRPE